MPGCATGEITRGKAWMNKVGGRRTENRVHSKADSKVNKKRQQGIKGKKKKIIRLGRCHRRLTGVRPKCNIQR